MTTQTEVPFLAGMEREGSVCETTIEVGKKAFQLDGVLDRLLQKARAILESRAHERGPDPDFAEASSTDRVLIELLREIRRPSYSNGGDESNWKTIALFVMGFLQALILAFMAYIYSTTSQTHDDVIRIKCRLDPQSCMGSPANVVTRP